LFPSPWIYLNAFIVSFTFNLFITCHVCSFRFNFVTKLHQLCRSCLVIVFSPMDTFHRSGYAHLSVVVSVKSLSFWILWALNRSCFVFRQMDGRFDYFNRHNRICIGRKDA
jgi:hypothetical protein